MNYVFKRNKHQIFGGFSSVAFSLKTQEVDFCDGIRRNVSQPVPEVVQRTTFLSAWHRGRLFSEIQMNIYIDIKEQRKYKIWRMVC